MVVYLYLFFYQVGIVIKLYEVVKTIKLQESVPGGGPTGFLVLSSSLHSGCYISKDLRYSRKSLQRIWSLIVDC